MTPERFQKVDRIFQAAMELPPGDRAAFLDRACAGDESLRREVEGLIASDEHGLSFIEDPAFEVVANLLVHTEPELVDGHTLGHYKILQLIGRGGMGEVYLAEDTELGRKIAIKLLPAEYTKDPDRLRRFRQEARAASALNHPNILTIHQIAQFEGRHYMATEFVDGETLRQRLKRARLMFDEVLEVANQVGSALAAAHEAGIVHRDIKPENIMLRRDGYVKVLDFGLAKLTETTTAISTHTGQVDSDLRLVMGTVKYMSPEQARGLEVDGRSDVFSFGVVLYELLTGHAPFQGDTTSDLLAALLKEEPAPLAEHLPDVPEPVQQLLTKCLNKKKENRYQTIGELLIDLKALRSENLSGVEILSQSVQRAAITSSASRVTSTLSVEYIISGIKRHKTSAAFVLASLVIVGIGSTFGLRRMMRGLNSTAEMNLTRVSNTEKSYAAAVSPDGKFIAQTVIEKGKGDIWLLDVTTNNSVELVKAGGGDLTFSKDGKRLYYNEGGNLFEVSLAGGEPRKVLSDVTGPVGFSPNGDRFAFVRGLSSDEKVLLLANVDGSGEQELIRRKPPEYISGGPAWSPDGSLIAYSFGVNASNKQAGLAAFDLNTRQSKEITSYRWHGIERLAWLSDGSGLVMPATDDTNTFPLWLVPFPTGEPRTITKDLNLYADSTLTAEDNSIVAIQYQQRSALWIIPAGNPTAARPLNTSKHQLFRAIAVMPDGSILYPSNASGKRDIWVMNADGTNPRQLTNNAGNNQIPYGSPDGRYIFFSSNRDNTGAFNIWRMNADGSNPIQLTRVKGAVEGTATPDGKWVFFSMGGPETQRDAKTIWKVSIDGGEPVQITNTPSTGPSISADGTTFACWYKKDKGSPWTIAILPIAGGPPIKIFPANRNTTNRPLWTPDGQGLTYIYTVDGVSNIWIQPINGDPPKQFTQFTSEQIESSAWTPNGDLICPRSSQGQDVVRISNFR